MEDAHNVHRLITMLTYSLFSFKKKALIVQRKIIAINKIGKIVKYEQIILDCASNV